MWLFSSCFFCVRAVAFDNNTYPLPALIARYANAYSSTNQDLKNTNGTNFASNEYLNATDELKDVRDWVASGLSDEMILSLLPSPKASDIINPEILTPILVSKASALTRNKDIQVINSQLTFLSLLIRTLHPLELLHCMHRCIRKDRRNQKFLCSCIPE